MKTRYASLLTACICLWFGVSNGFSRQVDVSRANAQYVDKLFGTHFTFAPKSDEVMIKFSGGGSSLQKTGIANMVARYRLQIVHDAVELQRFGVYRAPGGISLSGLVDQLQREAAVQAVCPVMIDQNREVRYFIPDEFTVQFNKNMSKDDELEIIREQGCRVITAHWTKGYYTLSVPANGELFQTIRTFMGMPEVKFSELSYIGFNDIAFDPNDTHYAQQWALNNTGTTGGTNDADIDAREGWDIERGDADILVVVIDSGVEWDHPDLRANIAQNLGEDDDGDGRTLQQVGGVWVMDPGDLNGVDDDGNGKVDDLIGWDFASDDRDPTPVAMDASDDSYPHGTCCAGIAAAVTNNNLGVAGVAHNCRLMGLRVNLYSGMNQNRADAINYAVMMAGDYDGAVISCSWVASGDITAIHNAIVDARNDGVLCCFAAGNADTTPCRHPAQYAEAMAVGAASECDERKDETTSCDGENWWGSNYGDSLDISAPGVHLYTTDMVGADGYGGGDYIADMNGTSGATPHVAGAAALLLSYDSSLTPDELQDILQQSADKIGGYNYSHDATRPGHSLEMGYGRLNVNRALQMVMARSGAITDLLPTPLDLVLSLDHSGSMVSAKLDAVKNAAAQVVRLLNVGDNLGISIYDHSVDPLFPAGGGTTVVLSDATKDSAENAIDSITRDGATSIGGGLEYAQTQLETIASPNYPQAIILMSDGLSNTAPWIKSVVPAIPGNTDAYTIGFGTAGENVDEDSLQYIATQTGAVYLFAGADALVERALQKEEMLSSGGMEIIRAYQYSLNQSANRQTYQLLAKPFKEKFDEPVAVDESVSEMRFSFLGENPKGNYTLLLFSPSGKKIDPGVAAAEPDIDYIEGRTVRSYSVRNPETGTWHMVGTGSGQRYFISASAYSSLKSILTLVNRGPCRPLLILLRLIQMGEPLWGATVEAKIGLPNNEYAALRLFDDGKSGDGSPRDGVYGGYFENTCREGSYSVETMAEGVTRKQLPFTRYNTASIAITKNPDLSAIFVSLPHLVAPREQQVLVPIHVNPDLTGRGIIGFSTDITFDPKVISPAKELLLKNTLLADNWMFKYEKPADDRVHIEGRGPALSGSGTLLNMVHKVVGKIGARSKLTFETFVFTGDEKSYDVRLNHGSLKVGEIKLFTAVNPAEVDAAIPAQYALRQNYPNPFNPDTRIQYDLPVHARVQLTVYNILGQEVARLVDRSMPAGYHTILWNGCDRFERPVPSGIYLCRLQTDRYVSVRKMFLLR